ncbi:MAG: alpha/beta hydrolase [Polyangiales bacterium]
MGERVLGHERVGDGARRVIVLNDWICDTSTWDDARPYLDRAAFTWVFADLRGYGRSRGYGGRCDVAECVGDVLALADHLGWERFSIVGHSMSTYAAMRLGQTHADRVERAVLVTPGPPRGFGADAQWLAQAEETARDDAKRAEMIRQRFTGRLSAGWAARKAERWVERSDAEAAAGYIAMYARDGLPEPGAPIAAPVLAITGDEDAPVMRRDAVLSALTPLCARLEVVGLANVGHYPMQEMPPYTVALVERFLSGA